MKSFVKTLVGTAAVAAMVASGSALAATKLRLSCPSAANNPTCVPAYVFAKEVERLTNGSVIVQVFPSGQLGKGKEAIQQMQAGIIDLTVESIGRYSAFVKDLNVFTWGFTFRDAGHFNKFLYSPTGNAMFEEMDKKHGIVFLARNWRKLPRVVVSSKPVFSPDDLSGLKFRVPSIPTYIKTWQTLGANPTQVAWADAFQALKTGVVDGMEAPFDSVLAQKFHIAVPYVTMTNHLYTAITLAANAKRFYGLSKGEQEAFREAAEAATAKSIELARKSSMEVADKMIADGAFVIRLKPTAFQTKLQEAAKQQEAEGLWSKGLIDMIGKM